MSESYDRLTGASGKARFFRPTRLRAKEIFAGETPRLFFDDEEFTVVDLTANGLGALGRQDAPGQSVVGARGLLRLTQRGRLLFSCPARKAHQSPHAAAIRTGFELQGGAIDLRELVYLNANALAAGGGAARFQVSREYKSFCADASAFLGDYLGKIDRYFAPHLSTLSEMEKNDAARELSDQANDAWREILEAGNKAVLVVHDDKAARLEFKQYTENVITQRLLEGPGWARCYYKPAGYPGDFRIMNYGYDRQPEGETIRAKFLHLLGMSAARSIYARMEILSGLLLDYASQLPADRQTCKIASIGSGPARELREIALRNGGRHAWEATLIDQDSEALEFAYDDIRSLRESECINVTGLNISFKDMLNPSARHGSYVGADVIYSAGLFDYLSPLMAQHLLQKLYDFVRPGGQVIIGHVSKKPSGMIWALEYVTDWSLYFRTPEEMLALAAPIGGAKPKLIEDELGGVYFLVLEKHD